MIATIQNVRLVKMKRLLSLFLVAVLLLAVIPSFSVSAAKQPAFVVSTADGTVGDAVKITISTKNNPGIISMQLLVKYDDKALKLKKATEGKLKSIAYSPLTNNPFTITWIDPLSPNNKTNGVISTLEFEILDTAPNGKSEISLSYDPDNVFEYNTSAPDNFKNVDFAIENGYVDIDNPNPPKQQETSSQESVDTSSESTSSEVTSNESASSKETSSKVTSSQKVNSTAQSSSESGTQSQDNVYQQMIESLISSSNDSKTENGNEASTLESEAIITDGAITGDTNVDEHESQNGWLLWVVIAAVVVLAGSFAVVIVKNKKSK